MLKLDLAPSKWKILIPLIGINVLVWYEKKREFIKALNRKNKIDEAKYIEGLADRGKYLNVALYSGLKDQKQCFHSGKRRSIQFHEKGSLPQLREKLEE